MRRKIIRQGHNTFTVSLPKKWCDNHGLKEGDEVDIGEKGDCLLLSKEAYRGSGEITVDITGLDRSTIIILIESLYTYGYDKINVTTKDPKVRYHMLGKDLPIQSVIHYATNLLIGAEIVSSSKNRYEIAVMTEDSRDKFDMTIRRIFLLIMDLYDTFLEGVRKKDKTIIESVDLQHSNIMKFINYALRLLNKFGHGDAEKTTYYFSIVHFLNKAERAPKNLTWYIMTHLNISKKACDMMEEIFSGFKEFYETFYKYDIKKIADIHKKRDLFRIKLHQQEYKTLSNDDVFLLASLSPIYEFILDLCELRMAIEH
jgi:phosphate uptake regulator